MLRLNKKKLIRLLVQLILKMEKKVVAKKQEMPQLRLQNQQSPHLNQFQHPLLMVFMIGQRNHTLTINFSTHQSILLTQKDAQI